MDQVRLTECYISGPNHLELIHHFFKLQINNFLSDCAEEQNGNSLGNLDCEFIVE